MDDPLCLNLLLKNILGTHYLQICLCMNWNLGNPVESIPLKIRWITSSSEQSTGWPDSSSHSGVSHAAMYVFLLFMGATAIPLELANFRQIFIFLVQIDLCLSLAIRFVPKDMIIDKSLFASFSLHRTQFANPISGFTKMSKFFFSSILNFKVSFQKI